MNQEEVTDMLARDQPNPFRGKYDLAGRTQDESSTSNLRQD